MRDKTPKHLLPHRNLPTVRRDVVVNRRQIAVPNASWIGYSRSPLRFGDFFLGSLQASHSSILCRCMGTVSPTSSTIVYVLAQALVNPLNGTFSERWFSPESVRETLPPEHMEPEIFALFQRKLETWESHQPGFLT